MVSKTRKRQLRKSNRENSFEQVNETPNVSVSAIKFRQNVTKFGPTLSDAEIDAMIRNAVERELVRFGISNNTNNVRDELIQSSSRVNNLLTNDNDQNSENISRATHFVVSNGNVGLNRSSEHNYPNPAALAKQKKTGLDQVTCHRWILFNISILFIFRYFSAGNNEILNILIFFISSSMIWFIIFHCWWGYKVKYSQHRRRLFSKSTIRTFWTQVIKFSLGAIVTSNLIDY